MSPLDGLTPQQIATLRAVADGRSRQELKGQTLKSLRRLRLVARRGTVGATYWLTARGRRYIELMDERWPSHALHKRVADCFGDRIEVRR